MDMVKIGQFLADLRHERNLTQEQLGEELGVSNKTISRWETGTYLPPVEMLQLLSEKYNITINEILAGERLSDDGFKEKAEENLTNALGSSVFTLAEKKSLFGKRWVKRHLAELLIEIAIFIAAIVLVRIYYMPAMPACSIVCIVWSFWVNNRKQGYIEGQLLNEAESNSKRK